MADEKKRYWVVINFTSGRTERVYWEGATYIDVSHELNYIDPELEDWKDNFRWISETLINCNLVESISFEDATREDEIAEKQR